MSMSKSRLHQLSELGQSVWIDFLSREMLRSGKLARLMEEDAVVGITSNPTIFQKAISEGDAYDEQIRACLEQTDDPREIFWRLAEKDVGDACDVLRPVWDEGHGRDGYVSIEVDPNLAGDTEGTIAEARRLHAEIDRPNLDLFAAALRRSGRVVYPRAREAGRLGRRSVQGRLGGELLRLPRGHRDR